MILEQCKGVHCADLGESFQTHIYFQNFASIQPRTSPVKFASQHVRSGSDRSAGPPTTQAGVLHELGPDSGTASHAGEFSGMYFCAALCVRNVSGFSIQHCWRASARAWGRERRTRVKIRKTKLRRHQLSKISRTKMRRRQPK